MNNYSCIIVDDEIQAIELLSDSLSVLNKNIHVIGTYSSWTAALQAMRSTECDILFLDISMHGRNGMDLLRSVPNYKSEVIFVTAYSNYCIDAFKHAASGYILKPINEIELANTIDKTIQRVQSKKMADSKLLRSTYTLSQKIGIPNYKGIEYVNIDEVLYFEAANRYVKVVLKDTEILSSFSLGNFKKIVEEYPFFQVHRSYIINLNFIRRYESVGTVVMSNDQEIPISRNMKDEFLEIFYKITHINEFKHL